MKSNSVYYNLYNNYNGYVDGVGYSDLNYDNKLMIAQYTNIISYTNFGEYTVANCRGTYTDGIDSGYYFQILLNNNKYYGPPNGGNNWDQFMQCMN